MTDLTNPTEFLYSLKNLDNEIRDKIDLLDELRSIATSVTASNEGERIQTSCSGDKLPKIVSKIVDLEREIESEIDALADRRNTARDIILTIQNETYQNILYDYFICNEPLWQVAENHNLKYNNAKQKLWRSKKVYEKIYKDKKKQKIQDIVAYNK